MFVCRILLKPFSLVTGCNVKIVTFYALILKSMIVMFARNSRLDSTVFILTNHYTIYIITMVALPSHAMNQ